MRQFVLIVVGLLVLVMSLAGPVVARLAHPRADCSNRVLVVKGSQGEPLECVCIEGAMATCFKRGL
jgi:hypothetical protein